MQAAIKPNTATSVLIGNRKNNLAGAQTVTFGDEEHVFYELSNQKSGQKKHRRPFPNPEGGDEELDEDDEEEYARKSCRNQAQADEMKRQQLEKILEEQVKKFKEREKKLAAQNITEAMHGSGVVGRYVA